MVMRLESWLLHASIAIADSECAKLLEESSASITHRCEFPAAGPFAPSGEALWAIDILLYYFVDKVAGFHLSHVAAKPEVARVFCQSTTRPRTR